MDGSSQMGRATAAGGGDAVLHTSRLHGEVENSNWLHRPCVGRAESIVCGVSPLTTNQ